MDNIRCLIADIPQIVLADIVQHIVESRLGVDVVGRIETKKHISQIVRDNKVDVVVFGTDDNFFPEEWRDIRDSDPELLFVGLIEDGRHAAIFINDIGPDQLMNLVKVSLNNNVPSHREAD